MKNILLMIFTVAIERSYSTDNLENTLSHCCNIGKSWYMDKKSCNITLSFPLFNVALEHNTMCLTTVGACCLHSLREVRCDEGKHVGLENGICNENIHQGKNQVDFMMCCEICKIGMTVGLKTSTCQTTKFFQNHQWGEVYQSCCSIANTKVKSLTTEVMQNYNTPDINQCIDGTHDCSPQEKCVKTQYGFECHSLQSPLQLSMIPERLTKYKTKQNCDIGYTYNSFEQKCKDINECDQRPCDVNEVCENTIGSFKCHCKGGFQLDEITNACTDINECQLNLHTCQESQRCDNTAGSYQCVRFTGCGTGYTLDVESALCIDDDECALKTDTCRVMGPDWVCRNTLGSFRCEKKRCTGSSCKVRSGVNVANAIQSGVSKCLRGYEMDKNNKCLDVNECKSPNQCSTNELCINTNGSFYCLPKSKNFPL